jgi:hypothetical protein
MFWPRTTLSQLATGDNHPVTMPGVHGGLPSVFELWRWHFGWFLLCGLGGLSIDLIDRVETIGVLTKRHPIACCFDD